MIHSKAFAVTIMIVSTVMVFNEACQKQPETLAPDDTNRGGPNLPAVPYDYKSSSAMPDHIRNYILANPGIDNTSSGNPITNEGATLGRVLFYDKSLSANNSISCGSCHHQDKAFTDGKPKSTGFEGKLTRRNAMSLVNLRFFQAKAMFWDLRAATLEEQVLLPIQDHIEMGIPSIAALEEKLQSLSYYPPLFKAAFGSSEIKGDKISKALSQFLRSITSFDSKYDQGISNNFAAFTPEEMEGKRMITRAFCTECHSDLSNVATRNNPSFLIVENSGLNTGFGSNNALDEKYSDEGIGEKTGASKDMGTFKIPTLRNIELTGPYMHDGRFSTLEQVIDHYGSGIKNHPNRGIQIPKNGFQFSQQEKKAIISFLKTLTDNSLINDKRYSDPFQ